MRGFAPEQRRQQWLKQQMRADKRRGRIAGEPEQQAPICEARVPARLARLDRDLVEVDRALKFGDDAAQIVALADRGAADEQQDVGLRGRYRGTDRGRIVGKRWLAVGHSAPERNERCDGMRGGIGDFAGGQRLARLTQFVTRREDRNARPSAERECGMIGGAGKAERAGGQRLARREQALASAEIAPRRPDEQRFVDRAGEDHAVAVAGDDFLHDDALGAVRDHAAGSDAHRRAALDPARKRRPGEGIADQPQPRSRDRVRVRDGVAVHRRGWQRGLIE